ncbi:hypothetical protein [Kitasatospora terrestris]|uniref:Uncharacterized protein n=1 Tax=Kitasatospora terrestris TaxID=258051 RepID=A0ABP9ER66_9ACTN
MVAEALVRVGVPAGEAPRPAERLLVGHPLWDPARWSLPGASPLGGGGATYPGVLLCDDPGSPRTRIRLARGIGREQHEQLARALGTWQP